MTPTPGVLVKSGASPAGSSIPVDIGTWFVSGLTEKGPINEQVLIRSLNQYVTVFGGRVAYGSLYDALDTFFHEGGNRAYVSRVVGPAQATATVNLSDGSTNTLKVVAVNPGEWGNSLSVVTTVPSAGNFQFQVKLGEVVVQESPVLATTIEAVSWASTSPFVRMELLGANDPVAATKTLTTGADDRTSVTETQWKTALDLFARHLGPGQVSMPGRTTATAQTNVLAHCESKGRTALLDGTDTATVGTLTSQAATLRALSTARYGGLFAPWVLIPGTTVGTTRTVPPCALVAGIMARNDGLGYNPNVPAAGDNGVSRYAVGLSQAPWTEAQRGELNDGGVNAVRLLNGAVEIYGYRTLVNTVVDNTWQYLSNARLDAFIKAKAGQVGDRFIFRQLGRKVPAEFGSAIEGEVLLPLFNDEALYGDTFGEAAQVDIGEAVNTKLSLEEGKLKAVVGVRMSPLSELIEIEIVKEAI